MTNAYQTKLKNPRWQRKRLEILQRDDWTCQVCFIKDKTLAVHHKDYLPNREPWDYPDDLLITLCEDCHGDESNMASIEQSIIHHLRKYFLLGDFCILEDGLNKLTTNENGYVLAHSIRWLLMNPKIQRKLFIKYLADVKNNRQTSPS